MSENVVLTPADIFCEMQNSENTKRAYRNDIRKWEQFLASRKYAETPETALAFKQTLEDVYAPATAQRVFCTVAAFYGWLKGTGRSEASPFHGLKSPSRPSNEPPPVPSNEEVAELIRATEDGTVYGERSKVIVCLLLNGLRAQEVCDALRSNITFDQINEQWILDVLGKGEKWRAVPLTSETQQAIFDYNLNNTIKSDYVVGAIKDGKQLNVKTIWRTVEYFARKAKVVGIHPHALRHHYATRLVRAGVDVFTLQKLMGHQRADTTQKYVGLDYSDLSAAVKLDPMHNVNEVHHTLFYGTRKVDNEPATI